MNLLELPPIIKEEIISSNNIQHFLFPKVAIEINRFIEKGNYTLIETSTEEVICIVKKGCKHPEQFERVILSEEKPTQQYLLSKDSRLKWKKHPEFKNDLTPAEVIDSWHNQFHFKEEDLEKKVSGLRIPQIAALFSVLSHWKVGNDIGTVVMPTGTGKTETMLSLLIANKCQKVLVIVPTDPLREQISKKFLTLGYLQNTDFGIVGKDCKKPIVGVLYRNFNTKEELENFIDKCNVVITTMYLITELKSSLQGILANKVSHLFIDEAHHSEAPTWSNFRALFERKKVLQFTATPYRNDGKKIDGTTIFNYTLKQAQDDGYFKKINLIQVHEYDTTKADEVIADAAVAQLKKDLENYDHILMARCNSKTKANFIYKIYEKYPEYNPVLIHTGISTVKRNEAKVKLLNKVSKIVVCVDMLGEGFDLPNLKIAAFHDIRKSLPITIQLAGRFTRTSIDHTLGIATIVVNLKDSDVIKELEDFYALGADWNSLLPQVSTARVNKEINFTKFIEGFDELDSSKIPINSLTPALSTVVYKNHTNSWLPNNFESGLRNVDALDYLYHSLNRDEKTLVIITGKKNFIDWGYSKDIYDIVWTLYIVFWDSKQNLLFINSSDNGSLYHEMADAIVGSKAEIINKINVFKVFASIQRLRLQNVGLKEFLGKHSSFSMKTGYDVEKALSLAEKQSAEKAFVFGIGYDEGNKVSLGCSYKGRIWSRRSGDLPELVDWCSELGEKLIDETIDPNTVLKETLLPNSISVRPKVIPFAVDWNELIYLEHETRFKFLINGTPYEIFNTELQLLNITDSGDLSFQLVTEDIAIELKQLMFNNGKFDDFKVEQVKDIGKCIVEFGRKQKTIEEFFYDYPPIFWFVDASSLTGNDYVELKQLIPNYPQESIIGQAWDFVDLRKESQGIDPKKTDSIQYKVIEDLKAGDYDIIYDDDYSGEIADVITVKQFEEAIHVQLYHLKFAKEGKVSKKVDDLYEVCGQAVKSVNWKFKEGKEFFEHLLRREIKKRKDKSCSRIEVGSKEKLVFLKEIARKKYPVEFEIFIIQPALSCLNASVEQLTLLGVASNYLKTRALIDLVVIGSDK